MKQQILRTIAAFAIAYGVGACALSEDKVAIDFAPSTTPAAVAGAGAVTVSVAATDKRLQYADRIGTKKNGYGMEMARIVATNDVVALVRTSLERQLKAEGFQIGAGQAAIEVEVQNFYNNFQAGLMTGKAVAEVSFSARVRNPAGTLLYSQFYTGTGTVDGIVMASGTNAKAGVEKALADAIDKAIEDTELRKALLSTPPKPGPAGVRRVGA